MARRSMDGRGCGCACCTPRCMKSLMYKLYNALYSTHTLSHGILEAIQYTAAIQRIHLIHLIQYTAAIQRIHYTSLFTPPLARAAAACAREPLFGIPASVQEKMKEAFDNA